MNKKQLKQWLLEGICVFVFVWGILMAFGLFKALFPGYWAIPGIILCIIVGPFLFDMPELFSKETPELTTKKRNVTNKKS